MWLGTPSGLYRFDGAEFERYELPPGGRSGSDYVYSLRSASDGGLWIGFGLGGAIHLKGGRAVNYGESEGLPLGTLADFAIDREGTVWAATHAGLARLDGTRWRHIGQDWGYPGRSARALFVDRDGTLWVATEDTLVFLPLGQKAFQKTSALVRTVDRIAQSPDGAIWIVEVGRIWKFLDASGNKDTKKKLGITLQGPGILFDRAGSLWISTWGAGVLRLPFPEQLKNGRPSSDIEKFTQRDGLTDDTQDALLQDHEGNIWVGTKDGLDRFRRTDLSPVALPTRTRVTLVAGNHGDVWAFLGLQGNEFVHVLRTAGVTQRFR